MKGFEALRKNLKARKEERFLKKFETTPNHFTLKNALPRATVESVMSLLCKRGCVDITPMIKNGEKYLDVKLTPSSIKTRGNRVRLSPDTKSSVYRGKYQDCYITNYNLEDEEEQKKFFSEYQSMIALSTNGYKKYKFSDCIILVVSRECITTIDEVLSYEYQTTAKKKYCFRPISCY